MARDAGNGGPDTIVNIEGPTVALGPLRRDLLPLYARWANDFHTGRTLGLLPRPLTAEAELQWFESAATARDEANFTIYVRATGTPIGNTALHAIDYRHGTAGFGLLIGEPGERGKGYGTETTRLVLEYAFTALGLRNVLLTVYAFNYAGRRAYVKAGFKEIGRRRQCHFMGGRYWDVVYMDCLAAEFAGTALRTLFAPDEPRG